MRKTSKAELQAELQAAHAEYPAGFKQWAFWQIDLSYHAPTLDKQLAALLTTWNKEHAQPQQPAGGRGQA